MHFLMDFMRHHRFWIQVFIFLFIAIPFCMWTVPGDGGCSPSTVSGDVLGSVGAEQLMMADFQQSLERVANQSGTPDKRPTMAELNANGTIDRVLLQMENGAYFRMKETSRDFDVDNQVAVAKLKQSPRFQTADGKFVPAAYNEWVESRRDADWSAIYESVKQDVEREVFFSMVTAPAGRVLDKEVEDELIGNTVKLKVKLAAIEPPVDVDEATLQERFSKNQEQYRNPSRRTVEYAAVSVLPEVPEKALEAVKKAREGADFVALTEEYSDPKTSQGDLGWTTISDDEAGPRKILATLAPGTVSDPVMMATGALIFKVEEERTNAETGKREVKARQIHIAAKLSEETMKERRAKADGVLNKAKADSNLAAAAGEAGLQVAQTPPFTMKDAQVQGIPQSDSFKFRQTIDKLPADTPFTLVEGRENLYVAHVLSTEQGDIPPFEEVRERVKNDAVADLKKADDYKNKVQEFCDKLAKEQGTMEEISGRYPELALVVKETEPFTQRDFTVLSKAQCYVSPDKITAAFKDKAAGTTVGPIRDYFGKAYIMQLVERIEPTEEEKAKFDEERKTIREQRKSMAQAMCLDDYIIGLRAQYATEHPVQWDGARLESIRGAGAADSPAPQEGEGGAPAPAAQAPAAPAAQ